VSVLPKNKSRKYMAKKSNLRAIVALIFVSLGLAACVSQVPSNEGLVNIPPPPSLQAPLESVITVGLPNGFTQSGLLSRSRNERRIKYLVILAPGYPGILRPALRPDGSVNIRQAGNFLIRARGFLIDHDIATLAVDCRSDFDSICDDFYQASPERVRDLEILIAQTRQDLPSVEEVWIVSTSRGALTSAAAVRYGGNTFNGAVHTAGVMDPIRDLGREGPRLREEFLIHHAQDPCSLTPYSRAEQVSKERDISLITARGGRAWGLACQAFTQHGFNGIEHLVMARIRGLIRGTERDQLNIP
jgi:hypothetical protein